MSLISPNDIAKNIGCCWSSSVFATDGDQWQTPIWHENQWPVGCWTKKTDEDQRQPMFFLSSFRLYCEFQMDPRACELSWNLIQLLYRFELLWALPDLEKLQRRLNTLPRPSSVPWGWTFGDRSGRPLVWCRKFPRWNGIPFPKGYANLVRGLSTYQRKWLTTNYSLRHFQVD